MRSTVVWLLPLAIASAAWPACKNGSAAKADGTRGVTVLYQNNANGEIEPCGWPKNPLGGLARKAQYTETVRKEAAASGRAVLVLDAGDILFPDEPLVPEEVEQRRVKAELILAANKAMGVDFAAVGDQDLKLGVEWLKKAAETHGFPFHSANLVTNDGKPVFPGRRVLDVGGVKVGFFSVLTPDGRDGKPLLEDNPHYRIDDPLESAAREVKALQAEGAQAIVAVTHLGLIEDKRLGNEVPGIHFIFGAHSGSMVGEPEKGGSAFVFQAGTRGKYLGRVDIDLKGELPEALATLRDVSSLQKQRERVKHYESEVVTLKARLDSETDPDRKLMIQDQVDFYTEQLAIETKKVPADADSGSGLENRMVPLSREIADDPTVGALVTAALEKIASLPPPPQVTSSVEDLKGPESGPYVGVTVCQGCHPAQWAQWRTTGHAKAYKTLEEEMHAVDFDCVGCHTTGYRKEGGPQDPFTIAGFQHVQCESCHGPGRAHAKEPKKVKLTKTFDEAFCRTCHSVEQTGDRFVFADYLPKVAHPNPAK